jgi:hypothetical protein
MSDFRARWRPPDRRKNPSRATTGFFQNTQGNDHAGENINPLLPVKSLSAEAQRSRRWGINPPPAAIKIIRWQPVESGATIAQFYAELPSGLILAQLRLMRQKRVPVARPAGPESWHDGRTVLDKNGKQVWRSVIRFRDEKVEKDFKAKVLAALQAEYPQLFDGRLA